ncbi:MAG: BRO family protein [Clostridium sp.]
MNDLIVKTFKGKKCLNFVWNNRPCWIGIQLVEIFEYTQKSKTVLNCIKREGFEKGIEYDVLDGENLKEFKKIFSEELEELKFVSRVIIFYEQGLYGFLAYTNMPIGREFRRWIRREVIPDLREKGYYVLEGNEEVVETREVIVKDKANFDRDKFIRGALTYETAILFKDLLDDITKDSTYKFLMIKKIFTENGYELPKYIEEELME